MFVSVDTPFRIVDFDAIVKDNELIRVIHYDTDQGKLYPFIKVVNKRKVTYVLYENTIYISSVRYNRKKRKYEILVEFDDGIRIFDVYGSFGRKICEVIR